MTQRSRCHFQFAQHAANLHINVMLQLQNKDKYFDKCDTIKML